MKKLLLLFAVFVLTTACSKGTPEPEPEQTPKSERPLPKLPEPVVGIEPVEASEEFVVFMSDILPSPAHLPYSEMFPAPKNFDIEDISEASCLVINSVEEFAELIYWRDDLPEIDFEKYTFVAGMVWCGGTGWSPARQDISVSEDALVVNLLPSRKESMGGWSVICQMYFWGLYPKLPDLPISIRDMRIN